MRRSGLRTSNERKAVSAPFAFRCKSDGVRSQMKESKADKHNQYHTPTLHTATRENRALFEFFFERSKGARQGRPVVPERSHYLDTNGAFAPLARTLRLPAQDMHRKRLSPHMIALVSVRQSPYVRSALYRVKVKGTRKFCCELWLRILLCKH